MDIGPFEFYAEFGPLRQDVLFAYETLVAEKLFTGGVKEYLGRDDPDSVVFGEFRIFFDVNDLDFQAAGVFGFEILKDGSHHLAGDTSACSEVNECGQAVAYSLVGLAVCLRLAGGVCRRCRTMACLVLLDGNHNDHCGD